MKSEKDINARERQRWHTEPNYHSRWVKKNRAKISAQKKKRYATDPVYKEKMKENGRRRYKENRRAWLDDFRRRTYGITRIAFEVMLKKQRGCCAICRISDPGKRDWCVDHDHQTGRIRGLLCGRCNTGLGQFRDDQKLLRHAIKYLEVTK